MSVTSLFNFDQVIEKKDDKAGIMLVVQFSKAQKAFSGGVAKWVHSMAMEYNDPANPGIASANFQTHIDELVEFVRSAEAGEYQDLDFKCTGGGAFASAVKKIKNAMYYGADLCEAQTSNACADFAKKAAEAEDEEKRVAKVRQELIDSGQDPDDPKHMHLLQGGKKDTPPSAPQKDNLDILGDAFAKLLHDLREAGLPEHELTNQANTALNRLKTKLNSLTNGAAEASGFTHKTA